MTDTEDEYDDLEYNDEFESILQAAESQVGIPISFSIAPHSAQPIQSGSATDTSLNNDAQDIAAHQAGQLGKEFETSLGELVDIEDTPVLSPFERFRQHGKLSVSDLVGTVWCEVQVRPIFQECSVLE